ncbi:YceD family protein [Syntrophomonas erecta]
MKINVKDLQKHPHQHHQDFHIVKKVGDAFVDLEGVTIESIEIELTVENTGRVFPARGIICAVLKMQCSRCLKNYTYPFEADFFATLVDVSHRDEYQDEEDAVFIKEGEADLWPLLEEIIYSQLPINPLCSPECKGLCPQCGIDRNYGSCQCQEQEIDPRWEKLKNLR